jgi:hypothetical protein
MGGVTFMAAPPMQCSLISGSGETMGGISVKGVLVGAIVGTVASLFISALIAVLVLVIFPATHKPREVFDSHGFLALVMVVSGLGCCVLAGFTAASLSRHNELLNGGLSAFLCILLGILEMSGGKNTHPVLVQLLPIVAAPAFAILG